MARTQGRLAEARRPCEASLALYRELEDKPGIARTLNSLSGVVRDAHDIEGALCYAEESQALFQALGNRRDALAEDCRLGGAGVY